MSRRSTRISNVQPIIIAEGDESELSELESSSEKELEIEASVVTQKKSITRSGQSISKKIEVIQDSIGESSSEEEEEESEIEEGISDEDDNEYGKRKKKKLPNTKKKPIHKKARMISSSPSPLEETKQPKIFVPGPINSIPTDIFFEICSHLVPKSLLSLYKCCKLFRQYLAASDAQSIWTLSRKRVGIPDIIMNGNSEQQLAFLLFDKTCQMCGEGGGARHELYLRLRVCSKCIKLNWVNFTKFIRDKPDLHPRAIKCVMASPSGSAGHDWTGWSFSRCIFGIYSDIYKYDAILQDLELEDHVAHNERSRGSGRRSLGEVAQKNVKTESLVDAFVRERVAFLESHFIESVALINGLKSSTRLEEREAAREREAIWAVAHEIGRRRQSAAAEHQAKIVNKLLEAGRSRDEILRHVHYVTMRISEVLPEAENFQLSNDEVWSKIKPSLLNYFKIPKPTPVAAPTRPRVLDSPTSSDDSDLLVVAPVVAVVQLPSRSELERTAQGKIFAAFKLLRSSAATAVARNSYPIFGDFLHLPSIKSLLRQENNWSFVQSEWDSKIDTIKEEVEKHRIAVRIHAIKTILAATTLETYEELSKHDDDYFDEVKFDDQFFNNPTHFLVCNLWNCRPRHNWGWSRRGRNYGHTKFSSLNDLLKHQHEHQSHINERFKQISLGHFYLPDPVVFCLSAIVEVSRLDDDVLTIDELDNIGENLQWSNSYASKKLYNWRDLIEAVVSKNRTSSKNNPLPIPTISLVLPRKPKNGRR